MTYTDGSGKSAADYKSLILGSFSQRESDLRDDWYAFVDMVRAGFKGQKYEYKLTFAEVRPTSGAYITVQIAHIVNMVEDGAEMIRRSMNLLNKLFSLPSGVTILPPDSNPIDWAVFEEPYQSVKCIFITDMWYRIQGSSDSWTNKTLTHNQTIPTINVSLAYDTGSFLIWNHSTGTNFFLSYALGKEILNKWGNEDGIDKTIKWTYATEEPTTRYLKGDHVYWTTHGYPNGRKYRLYRDFWKHDFFYMRIIAAITAGCVYLGLPKKIISKVVSIFNSKMKTAKLLAPSNEILDKLDVTGDDPEAFKSLLDLIDRLELAVSSIETKIERVTYKPYGR